MLPVVDDPRLVVGTATADDAGVFQIAPDLTIVQTVDVFTPGVDDPFMFGRIAACNSLSDVYAMGGKPVTALSVIGFPIYSLPHEVMAEIIKGGMAVLEEAGAILLGGHSINDEEIKFGFAVTGVVEREAVVTNAGARPGDALILTKPLGTGIVALANQIGRASTEAVKACEASMSTLNRTAAELMVKHGAHACTDVTGFGLPGHLCQLVKESGVMAEVWCDRLPLLPNVREYADAGMYSGANERNAEYSAGVTTFADDIPESVRAILFDAQTSGGLLIAAPESVADDLLQDLHDADVPCAAVIGRIGGTSTGEISVTIGESHPHAKGATSENHIMTAKKESASEEQSCCAHGTDLQAGDSPIAMFTQFIGASMAPGAVDVVAKELIAVALALAVNCVPCSRIHIKKALEMGITADELEEAAALAIAFAGCRAMMLWNDLKKELLS